MFFQKFWDFLVNKKQKFLSQKKTLLCDPKKIQKITYPNGY
jgi:hypothetical protein